MNHFFARIYITLGVLLFLTLGLLVLSTGRPHQIPPAREADRLVQQVHDALRADLPPDALGRYLKRPVTVLEAREAALSLSPVELEKLEADTWALGFLEGPALFVPLEGGTVAAIGLPPPVPWVLVLQLIVVALGVVGAILLIVRPLQHQLDALSETATRLGDGHLDARAVTNPSDATHDLASVVNDMAGRIQDLLRGRQELLVAVSHELRTPVARLKFGTDLLADEPDPIRRQERAESIQRDLEELDALIGELLTYASLQDGIRDLSVAQVDTDAALERLVREADMLEPDITVHTDAADLPVLHADLRLLRRAVGNLLSNGVRYAKTQVEVRTETTATHLVLHVDDDGLGVPAKRREEVFEPMVRLDPSRSREEGGVGLGLAMARTIARRHDGDLICTSSPDGGARFTLTLPLYIPSGR